jgi:hypothetical protein
MVSAAGQIQAFVPTPAHADSEDAQGRYKSRDIDGRMQLD